MYMPGGAALVIVHVGAGFPACVALINLARGPVPLLEAIMLMSVTLRVWIMYIFHALTIGIISNGSRARTRLRPLDRAAFILQQMVVNGVLRDRRAVESC